MARYLGGAAVGAVIMLAGLLLLSPLTVVAGAWLLGASHYLGTIVYVESLSDRT